MNAGHILSLDSDKEFSRLLKTSLDGLGVRLEVAENKKELLIKIHNDPPECCLVDVNFDESNNIEKLITGIREVSLKVPLVILSKIQNTQQVRKCLEAGANDFIPKKGIGKALLIEKLSRYLKFKNSMYSRGKETQIAVGGASVQVFFCLKVTQVDEFGLHMESSSLLKKGSAVFFKGEILNEIIQEEREIVLTVLSVEKIKDQYELYAEFDESDAHLLSHVRQWCAKRLGVEERD